MSLKPMELAGMIADETLRTMAASGTRRVHRIGKPDEIEEENTMPRKAKDPNAVPTIDEAREKAKTRKKRKYTKRAKPAKAAESRNDGTEPTFIVDDAGRVAILDGDTRIDLSAGATKRLTAFLEKHA